ncbi:MAG: bifunctional UDP-N-acetylglucosamine diphosphorylase/glucosamine-1-phosphate N-acetyltransferase GlmU [Tissierellia bacterium]|nr:bifunctional UDP-N-acetylglucosamine diphosphorylase/glucosamine-1-phosphate N-acetyltransferase GlmU [Tissierellia bacterium]
MNKAIILAAGEGTRMKSKKPKSMQPILGKPMLEYIVEELKQADIDEIICIVGHGGETIREYFKDSNIIFKDQPIGEDEFYGTGFAAIQAIDEIKDEDEVLIVCGDTPLIRHETLKRLMEFNANENFDMTVLTATIKNPTGYGRIVRSDSGYVKKIVEQKDADDSEKGISEINSGIFVYNGKNLKAALQKLTTNNASGEMYLTETVSLFRNMGLNVGGYIMEDFSEASGINSRKELMEANKIMQDRIILKHLENGVNILNPDAVIIEPEVIIGSDTIIYPNAILQGKTEIGEDCTIIGNTRIVDSIIKDNVFLDNVVIEHSIVNRDTKIGPFAHIRPNTEIGSNVKIGNFVELKNASFKNGSKAGHLAYIGDADVGENVNIGCGVVFVNYDGKNKYRSKVEDNAFIGSNSSLVAPVHIEEYGYIAAGSTITKDVSNGELAIERSEQKNIKDWVKRKGLK